MTFFRNRYRERKSHQQIYRVNNKYAKATPYLIQITLRNTRMAASVFASVY